MRFRRAGAALALLLSPLVLEAAVQKGPYLVEMTAGSVRVRLETDTLLDTEVRFWPDSDPAAARTVVARPTAFRVKLQQLSAESVKKTVEREEERYLYEATLLDLAPGSRHHYRVFHGGEPGGAGRFRTFGRSSERTVFLAYGDVRTGHQNHRDLVRQFAAQEPDFLTIAGDLVVDGKVFAYWQQFFDAEAEVLHDIPLFPAWGNHEGRGGYFERYFPFPYPTQNRFFPFPRRVFNRSFDCGPVHVLVIDSGYSEDKEELKWIEEDLNAARDQPWKVAVYHHPSFNEGGHGSSYGVDKLIPVLRRCGVDLTLCGHSHLYERTYPLKGAGKDDRPMVHVVCGGGGAPLAQDIDAFYLASHKKSHHFVRIEADREKLVGTAIGIDGRPFDSFILRKSASRAGGSVALVADPAGSPGAEKGFKEEKVVAEESVALWRSLRAAFDSTARFRVPKPGPDAPLPEPVWWLLKVPACPVPVKVPVEVRLSAADAAAWRLIPESDHFQWGGKKDQRLFAIAPRNAEALTRKVSPRLEVRIAGPLGRFVQEVFLKVVFAEDGKSTRRMRM
jgi:3',5'-cyclic AMP phosphodiesterase CpdA